MIKWLTKFFQAQISIQCNQKRGAVIPQNLFGCIFTKRFGSVSFSSSKRKHRSAPQLLLITCPMRSQRQQLNLANLASAIVASSGAVISICFFFKIMWHHPAYLCTHECWRQNWGPKLSFWFLFLLKLSLIMLTTFCDIVYSSLLWKCRSTCRFVGVSVYWVLQGT